MERETLIYVVFVLLAALGARGQMNFPMPGPVSSGTVELNKPTCTSHNTLCHIAFNVSMVSPNGTVSRHSLSSEEPLCECPGHIKCPVRWDDTDRSVMNVFKGDSQSIYMKLNFCKLKLPKNVCKKNAVAVTLRGLGLLMADMDGPFRCRCRRVLFENRSWIDGRYKYVEYACGKPRCFLMKKKDNLVDPNKGRACMRITHVGDENSLAYMNPILGFSGATHLKYDYYCRCRYSEICRPEGSPAEPGQSTYGYCQGKSRKRRPGPIGRLRAPSRLN